MTITTGDRLPTATFLVPGADGPRELTSAELFDGRRVVVFGLPGAFTRVCSADHVPSFLRAAPGFRAKGVDEIVCLTVNDPFVIAAWDAATGASAGGIRIVGDPSAGFVEAIGLLMDAPAAGLFRRCRRFAMLVEDGVVGPISIEDGRGCTISAGEAFLETI